MSSTQEKMDRMYRYQRYIYDLTRKYYLLGRDRLIEEMHVCSGDSVLEIGCGTGRNLAILAGKNPGASFYGVDASVEMLATADLKLRRAGLKNVITKTALAEEFDYRATFGLDAQFDSIFFSYSISMIPEWRAAFKNGLENVKPGGSVYIVDFFDQKKLPAWFRRLLQNWLRQFHVRYPAQLIPFLAELETAGAGTLKMTPLFRSYSFISEFKTR